MTLLVRDLRACYGKSEVLHGVRLEGAPGEIVALLGRNGAGRSTCAKAIMGLLPASGSVSWRGQPLLGRPAHEIARLGLGYVPESRDVFPRLTVRQNLLLGEKQGANQGAKQGANQGAAGRAPWRMQDMFELFAPLKARERTEAGVLSGGEQQMLTLCRTLMGNPDLLLVDEPTEGLSPLMAQQVGRCLQMLQARGLGILLIEQKLSIALRIATRALVMGQGRIVFEGTPQALRADEKTWREWLQI